MCVCVYFCACLCDPTALELISWWKKCNVNQKMILQKLTIMMCYFSVFIFSRTTVFSFAVDFCVFLCYWWNKDQLWQHLSRSVLCSISMFGWFGLNCQYFPSRSRSDVAHGVFNIGQCFKGLITSSKGSFFFKFHVTVEHKFESPPLYLASERRISGIKTSSKW